MICDELPAVTLPSGLKAGFRLASVSTVVPGRMPSSAVTQLVGLDDACRSPCRAAWLCDGDDLVVEAALVGGLLGPLLALGAEGVEVLAGEAPLVGDHLGRDALGHEAAGVGVAGEHLGGRTGCEPGVTEAPIGVVVMTSTPAAMTMS